MSVGWRFIGLFHGVDVRKCLPGLNSKKIVEAAEWGRGVVGRSGVDDLSFMSFNPSE